MAEESLHLYYYPASFYSQKVLIALREKQLRYEETEIGLTTSGTYSPSYLKINPKGQVPVLQIGDKVIPESEAIIDAIDALPSQKVCRLVPDVSSVQGKLVSEWRSRLAAVPMIVIRFGVILNQEMQTPTTILPVTKEAWLASLSTGISHFEECKQTHPELSPVLDDMIRVFQSRQAAQMFQLDKVKAVYNDLDLMFDQVEALLVQGKQEDYHWLCGPDLSAADITLCVLIGRMILMGYETRYLDAVKRPALLEYWDRAMKYPPVGDTIRDAVPQLKK